MGGRKSLFLSTFGFLVSSCHNTSLSGGLFDDTDSDGLLHITNGEATEWWVLGELLDDHGLLWDELNHSGISGLDTGGILLGFLTSTLVDLGSDLGELASDVAGVAVKNWRVSISDLTGVVHDDYLGDKHLSVHGWIVLRVSGHVSSLDVLD